MNDRYRPLFHFTAPRGWINDPNGLLYFEGEYHLFYQHIPPEQGWGSGGRFLPHWGHAVSPDTLHWTHLPIALYPDHLGAIYSGSAVVDHSDTSGFFAGKAGLVAIFTHHNARAAPLGTEVQSIASSTDRGRTWTLFAQNPVIGNPGVRDFRDPKVLWHAPTRRWVMIVTYNTDRVRFYISENLREWSLASEFGAGQGVHDGAWECPDLFELAVDDDPRHTRWVLHLSTYHGTPTSERTGMQYFVGDFDGTTFHNTNPASTVLTTDYGRDNYAAITWGDPPAADGRRLMIGWMSDWAYARMTPTAPWQGAMTLPRELRLRQCAEGIRLIQRPVAEMELLRGRHARWTAQPLSPAHSVWERDIGEALDIVAIFQLGSATECGIRAHSGEREHTTVGYDRGTATLFVDRTQSGPADVSPAFSGRHAAPLAQVGETISMRLFIDRTSVEVFGNDGDSVVTSLIFPEGPQITLEFYATGGEARLVSADIFQIDAAQEAL